MKLAKKSCSQPDQQPNLDIDKFGAISVWHNYSPISPDASDSLKSSNEMSMSFEVEGIDLENGLEEDDITITEFVNILR